MTCLYSFLIYIILITATVSTDATCDPEQQCGPNEVVKDSPDCSSDCCPEEPDQPTACPDPCATACKCELMYKRAPNGTCIPSRQCPPITCPDNETFDSCPVCSEKCDNASPDGRRCRTVGRIGITVICQPACRCIDYYWRNDDNQCVPYGQCPQSQTDC